MLGSQVVVTVLRRISLRYLMPSRSGKTLGSLVARGAHVFPAADVRIGEEVVSRGGHLTLRSVRYGTAP